MSKWTPYTVEYNPLAAGSIDGTDTDPHDRAILRAMHANYAPPDVTTKPENTLFVGRLPYSIREDKLYEKFSRFGKIESVHLVRDIVTGQSKGYAFVEFCRKDDASEAMRESRGLEIEGYRVVVDKEAGHRLKGWIPRRLGGGWGGRKEAGQLRFGCVERPWKKPIIIHSKASVTSQSSGDPFCTFSTRDSDREREKHSSERRDHHFQDQHRRHSRHEEQKDKSGKDRHQRRSSEKDYKYKKVCDRKDEKYHDFDRQHKRDLQHHRHEKERHSSMDDERKRQYAWNDEKEHHYSKSNEEVAYSSRKYKKERHSARTHEKEKHVGRNEEKHQHYSRQDEKQLLSRNNETDILSSKPYDKSDIRAIQVATAGSHERLDKSDPQYSKTYGKHHIPHYQSKRDDQCSVQDDLIKTQKINDGDRSSESEAVKDRKKNGGKQVWKYDELMY